MARIIPRLVRKYRGRTTATLQPNFEKTPNQKGEYSVQDNPRDSQIQTNDVKVINELNRGPTKFEKIQKNTGIDSKELDSILRNLEKRGLMKVVHKQGLLGPKIELHATKNFKE